MRFRYKNQREDVFDINVVSSIISPKNKTKEKGLLERMIEDATIMARIIDALRAIGINSNLDNKEYSLAEYQN